MKSAFETTRVDLLASLREEYPTITFDVISKAETAHVDDERAADNLVGVIVNDCVIVDPFLSECGRFEVDPGPAYNVPAALALRLRNINGLA